MGRYKEPTKVQAAWWSEDEWAWIKKTLPFLAAQRVAAAVAGSRDLAQSADGAAPGISAYLAGAESAITILIELIDHWTLRKPGTEYEPGVDRPKWDLTRETLAEQPQEDIEFLLAECMRLYGSQTTSTENGIITPEAAVEGLTPANFPVASPA